MLIDTHAHLNDEKFDADRGAALERARTAGVLLIVEIADSPADWEKAVALVRARPGWLRCALGLHPYYAEQWTPALGEALLRKTALPEVAAVGEIGLDYAKCPLSPEVQKRALAGMLEAARSAEKPVVIHCREAYADLWPVLERFYAGPPKSGFHGVLHCFSGGLEDARRAATLGFALGVDGPVTYPKNDALRQALKAAGLASLVLETDSPYLPPQSSRGKRNEPAATAEIARSLASLFELDVAALAEKTSATARALFRI